MFLSDFSIKRPLAMVVIIVALMCLGLLALDKLQVNQGPDVQPPVLFVNVPYPGASPESVEREIIDRIEKPLQSIAGIDEVRSTANEGGASIVLTFNLGKSLLEAADDVRNAIATARYKLPVEMREPLIQRFDPAAQPIMQLALTSTVQSYSEISHLAEDQLADSFRAIDGVATVEVNGSLKPELSILLHSKKLSEFNVSVANVVNALRNQNAAAPVGKLTGEFEDKSLRLVGRLSTPAEFQRVVVKRQADKIVSLGDVAEIKDGFAEPSSYSFHKGQANVSLSISRAQSASTVTVASKVRELVAEFNKTLPPGTSLEVTMDGGKDAEISLRNVTDSLIFGACLTVFVVYVFLNSWRSTLITALSLPTSVITTFIAVWLCGFTLNFMTLLGLSLAIGVLIDDAIVVRENIVRHMERGLDRVTASHLGSKEIGLAVAATTFSIVSVFLPVAFMPGEAGEWFRPFALTVAISVLLSLFISFTLDPMLSAYWGDPMKHHGIQRRGISLWLEKFNAWFDRQGNRYGRVIVWALRHHRSMVFIGLLAFGAAVALQATVGGTSFFPASDSHSIAIDVRTPASSSLNYAKLKVEQAAELARTLSEVKATDSQINVSGGRIYLDIGESGTRKRTSQQVAANLRTLLARIVGAEFVVIDNLNNGSLRPVQIHFTGTETRKLMDITRSYVEALKKVPGAVDVGLSEQAPKDELRIELDRGLANSLGISANDLAQTLRVAFAGIEVGDWVDPAGKTRDVAVRLDPRERTSINDVGQLPIPVSSDGIVVPLEQIATITSNKELSRIQHVNGKRTIIVSASAQGRSAGQITADALRLAKSIDFPPGYGVDLAGGAKSAERMQSAMGIALLAGIGVMYMILILQFNSLTVPIPVMLSLPMSLIGVVLALLLTHNTLNLMSFIGVIMLMGLVAKNAILLLDAARKEELDGIPRKEALVHAGRKRFRPILMTTFALIAGMVPVAIGNGEGADFYRPMAVAIIGGTITSTMLSLVLIPAFYDGIETLRERIAAKFSRRKKSWTAFPAFVFTLMEALAALTLMRLVFRTLVSAVSRTTFTRKSTGSSRR
jgi:HAE1 family hydrophobic/amphiphilic exporter-1